MKRLAFSSKIYALAMWVLLLAAALYIAPSGSAEETGKSVKAELWTLQAENTDNLNAYYDDANVRICHASTDSTRAECRVEKFNLEDAVKLKANMYVCTRDRCVPAYSERSEKGKTLHEVKIYDLKRAGACGHGQLVRAGSRLQTPPDGPDILKLVPRSLYEFITDRNCCEDCWATHRAFGLSCKVDKVCCLGACGIEPGCVDGDPGEGGGMGPGEGGGEGGTDGENCGSERDVDSVPIEVGGQSCFFTGAVQPTMVNGQCVDVAGEGFIFGCTGGSGTITVVETGSESSKVGR